MTCRSSLVNRIPSIVPQILFTRKQIKLLTASRQFANILNMDIGRAFAACGHPSDEVVPCVVCDAPATHFTDSTDQYDAHCDRCYDKAFVPCPSCGAIVPADDLGTVETSAMTRWEPAGKSVV